MGYVTDMQWGHMVLALELIFQIGEGKYEQARLINNYKE